MGYFMGNELFSFKGRKKMAKQDKEHTEVPEEQDLNQAPSYVTNGVMQKNEEMLTNNPLSINVSYNPFYQGHDLTNGELIPSEPMASLVGEKEYDRLRGVYGSREKHTQQTISPNNINGKPNQDPKFNFQSLSVNGIGNFNQSPNTLNGDLSPIGCHDLYKNRETHPVTSLKAHGQDEYLIINPKNVFCPEGASKRVKEVVADSLIRPPPVVSEEQVIRGKKPKIKLKNTKLRPSDSKPKARKRQILHYIPNSNVPFVDRSQNLKPSKVISRKPMNLMEFHKMSNFNLHNQPAAPILRPHNISNIDKKPFTPNINAGLHVMFHSNCTIIPNKSTLLYAFDRRSLKFNQDPNFFRIPQPSNNFLIIKDSLRLIDSPHLFLRQPHKGIQAKPANTRGDFSRKIIRLKINGQLLYEHDYININKESVPTVSQVSLTEGSFITHLNAFNEKYGIPKLSVKYAVIMNFMYNEIRKKKGYFKVKPKDWKIMSHTIKDFVKVKELYFFLVYPFEQFLMGNTKVIRYKNPNICKGLRSSSKIFTGKEINLYLKRGTAEDLDRFFSLIDIKRLTVDGFRRIAQLMLDIYLVNIKDSSNFRTNRLANPLGHFKTLSGSTMNDFFPKDIHKFKFITNIDNDNKRSLRQSNSESDCIKNISKLRYDLSIKYIKNCVNIAIDYGKQRLKAFKVLEIDQYLLNNLYFTVLDCKELGIFSWEEFYDFANNCHKNFYPGTDVVYINLYKSTKHEPLSVLRSLSTIRFSKNKSKRLFQRLSRFIYATIDKVVESLRCKTILNDFKALEYIISSFYDLKGFRLQIRELVVDILKYYVFRYKNRIYQRGVNDSDLFKIIIRLMLFKDVRDHVHEKKELLDESKKVPGLGELV